MDRVVGLHPVLAALEAGKRSLERILVQRGRRGGALLTRILEEARSQGVPVRFHPRPALDRAARGAAHQGVVAFAAAVPFADEETVLAASGPAFLLILDGVEDPRNLGAVLRTAAAAGVHAVFLPQRGSTGPTPVAVKASAGALERLALVRTGNVASLLHRLQQRGIWVIGLEPGSPALWGGFDWNAPLALVVGGEGKGLRRLVRERCDRLVGIPMPGGGGSLNLSVAAAVALFEVIRSRERGASGKCPTDR